MKIIKEKREKVNKMRIKIIDWWVSKSWEKGWLKKNYNKNLYKHYLKGKNSSKIISKKTLNRSKSKDQDRM